MTTQLFLIACLKLRLIFIFSIESTYGKYFIYGSMSMMNFSQYRFGFIKMFYKIIRYKKNLNHYFILHVFIKKFFNTVMLASKFRMFYYIPRMGLLYPVDIVTDCICYFYTHRVHKAPP